MNLKKLSNKTLVRWLDELRGAMDIALNTLQVVEYSTLEKLYNEAKAELEKRQETSGHSQRF